MPDVNFVREILWPGLKLQERMGKKSPRTLKNDEYDAIQIENLYNGYFLTDDPFCRKSKILDEETVLTGVEFWRQSLKDSTIKRRLSVASKCITVMKKAKVRYRKISNPFQKPLVDFDITPRTRKVSREELATVMLAATQPMQDFILLSVNSGLRPGEIYNLTWDRVMTDRVIFVPGTWTDAGGQKNKSVMSCPLNQTANQILHRQQRISDYVFTLDDKPIDQDTYKRLWKKLMRSVDIEDLQFRDFRRTFGFEAAEALGVDMKDVQSVLRHLTMKVTESTYATPDSQERGKRAADAVSFDPHIGNVVTSNVDKFNG